jgi:hypothetical protein
MGHLFLHLFKALLPRRHHRRHVRVVQEPSQRAVTRVAKRHFNHGKGVTVTVEKVGRRS